MNRIQLNLRTGGVCYLVFCSFLDLITTVVTCCVALTRGRLIPIKKEDSKVGILRSLILSEVVFFGVVERY